MDITSIHKLLFGSVFLFGHPRKNCLGVPFGFPLEPHPAFGSAWGFSCDRFPVSTLARCSSCSYRSDFSRAGDPDASLKLGFHFWGAPVASIERGCSKKNTFWAWTTTMEKGGNLRERLKTGEFVQTDTGPCFGSLCAFMSFLFKPWRTQSRARETSRSRNFARCSSCKPLATP